MANQSVVQSLLKTFRSFSGVSDMSSDNQLLQNIIETHENTALLDPVEIENAPGTRGRQESILSSVPPETASTLKRSHWKNGTRHEKCFECTKKFSRLDRKRNCSMCGEVFCKNCTRFTRKISAQAVPDPLGTSYHVCHNCLMATIQDMGQEGNWGDYFVFFRDKKKEKKMKEMAVNQSKPLSQIGTLSSNKKERLNQELERLKVGFETRSSWAKYIVSDFKVPTWQKSSLWVDSSNAHQCRRCHTTFKRLAKKTNCRVCGQIYCSDCISKHEIMLYVHDNKKEVDWAINGKEGAPSKQPRSFLLLAVCKICEGMLEEMLVEEIEGPPEEEWDAQEDFMDTLSNLEAIMFKSRLRIENLLPQYVSLVDSMDIVDGAPRSSKSQSPIRDLARTQSNLSDHFSQLAIDSQKLRLLGPQTPTQAKLLKHVTVSIYKFYEDHMYTFKCCRRRLAHMMPIESIEGIQKLVNKMSVERVHVFIRQIMFEAINLDVKYKLTCTNVLEDLAQLIDLFELHLEKFYQDINEDWVKYHAAVSQMVREDFEGTNPEGKRRRRIRIPSNIPKTPFRNLLILRKILQQCSYYMHECLRELNAKTPDSFFCASKKKIQQFAESFDEQVAMLIQKHPHVFQVDTRASLSMNDYATGFRN